MMLQAGAADGVKLTLEVRRHEVEPLNHRHWDMAAAVQGADLTWAKTAGVHPPDVLLQQ